MLSSSAMLTSIVIAPSKFLLGVSESTPSLDDVFGMPSGIRPETEAQFHHRQCGGLRRGKKVTISRAGLLVRMGCDCAVRLGVSADQLRVG